ncbi:MAG: glycosyltransferase family 2 protein [Ferruginibacter sp.]
MSLSIVIVNFKSANYLLNCLKSAFDFPSAHTFEWIVVDNDSKDNSENLICSQYPSVRWINMGYNAGFARANNEGMRQATFDCILLLNPDTLIINDNIFNCYNLLNSDNAVAAATQLLNTDGSAQATGHYFMTGGLNHLLPLPYLGNFLKILGMMMGQKKTNVLAANERQEVDWLNGAFIMAKKIAIEKAGLMDEDFFLYFEEIEWCSRLKKMGKLVVYGNLFTTHLQGETINTATGNAEKGYLDIYSKKGLQLIISGNVRIKKQFGNKWFLFHLLILTLEIPLFAIFSILHHIIQLKYPFTEWNKVQSYSSNVLQLIKLSKKIYIGKPTFYKMF